jgi:hypothetical protein
MGAAKSSNVNGWYIVRKGNLTQSFPVVIAYNVLTGQMYTQPIPTTTEIIPLAMTDEPYVLLRGVEGSDKLLNLMTNTWVYVPAAHKPNTANAIGGRYYSHNDKFCYESDLINLPAGNILVKASKNELHHKLIYHDDLITAYLDLTIKDTVSLVIDDCHGDKKWSYIINSREYLQSVKIIRMANEWYYVRIPSVNKYFFIKLKETPKPIIIHPGD